MAQKGKSLPDKHEDLSLSPTNIHKKPGVLACPCDPSARELEEAASLGLTEELLLPNQYALGKAKDCLKNIKVESERG